MRNWLINFFLVFISNNKAVILVLVLVFFPPVICKLFSFCCAVLLIGLSTFRSHALLKTENMIAREGTQLAGLVLCMWTALKHAREPHSYHHIVHPEASNIDLNLWILYDRLWGCPAWFVLLHSNYTCSPHMRPCVYTCPLLVLLLCNYTALHLFSSTVAYIAKLLLFTSFM